MSDAYWGNIKDEKIELIENMKIWCSEFKFNMPTVDEKMRLEIIQEEFNKLKRQYWERLKISLKPLIIERIRKCSGGGCPYKEDGRCCIDCEEHKDNSCKAVCNVIKYSKPFDCEELEVLADNK